MSRITPPQQQTDLSQLKDYEPYRVSIKKIDWQESGPEYGNETRMVIDWALSTDPDFTIRDWVSLRLGRQQSGQVSKLRGILNAVAKKPEASDIAWFDDETLEWSYDGSQPFAALGEGLEVVIRGKVVEKPSDQGPKRRFSITVYQPAVDEPEAPKAAPVRGRPSPGSKPPVGRPAMSQRSAVTEVNPEDIPF